MPSNEQIVRACIQELKDRKLARTPPNVVALIRQKNLPFEGDYDELTALFWKILNDPDWEYRYKQIIAHEEEVETYRKAAGARRGRPPLANQGEKRDAFVGANVSADLKKWAENQPGGVSALINELLIAERERRLLQESPKQAL